MAEVLEFITIPVSIEKRVPLRIDYPVPAEPFLDDNGGKFWLECTSSRGTHGESFRFECYHKTIQWAKTRIGGS
jgi:hypothetical protein